jgi:hypothetical protein
MMRQELRVRGSNGTENRHKVDPTVVSLAATWELHPMSPPAPVPLVPVLVEEPAQDDAVGDPDEPEIGLGGGPPVMLERFTVE